MHVASAHAGRRMFPVLTQLWGHDVPTYGLWVLLGALVAWRVRRAEVARLGLAAAPGHRWVGVGALVGAVVGAKLGMVLFEPAASMSALLRRALTLDFAGKTVVGGLAGGYVGVELSKRAVGIRVSTGDAFAVALPLAQALGRVGCLFAGCCWGSETTLPWAVSLHGAARHPVQLFEAIALVALAAWLWRQRARPRPPGHLFRRYLVGYAVIRFVMQHWRADPVVRWGPLDAVQWVCLAAALGFSWLLWRGERGAVVRSSPRTSPRTSPQASRPEGQA